MKVPNITISRNNTTIYLGTIDDQFEGVPEIGTTATVDGEHTAEPAEEVTMVDTVAYKNLKVGETYKISGVLMDKETGEPTARWGTARLPQSWSSPPPVRKVRWS